MSFWLQIFTDLHRKRNLVPNVKEDADVPSTEKAVYGCKTKQNKIASHPAHGHEHCKKDKNEKEAANT
jgi:hypothetical protein